MESNKTYVLGVILAIAVVWISTSTSSVGAKGLYGAGGPWDWVGDCTPCHGETEVDCYKGPLYGCYHHDVDVCAVGADGSGRICTHTGNYPCSGTNPDCALAEETDCGY